MLNGVEERGFNKVRNLNNKLRRYHGASSKNIIDHMKPNLRKEPDEIIIHSGTKNMLNIINYLANVKKMIKAVH